MGSEKNNRARQGRKPIDPGVQTVPPFDKRTRLSIAARILGVPVSQLLREHFENPRERLIAPIGGDIDKRYCLGIFDKLEKEHPIRQTMPVGNDPTCDRCKCSYPILNAPRYLALCNIVEDNTRMVLCPSCRKALEQSGKTVRVY